jgi:hypothetical protein
MVQKPQGALSSLNNHGNLKAGFGNFIASEFRGIISMLIAG